MLNLTVSVVQGNPCFLYMCVPFTLHVQSSEFKMLGILMAMSILQGGPSLPIFSPVVYDYMSTNQYDPHRLSNKDVPERNVRHLLEQVRTIHTS